METNRQRSREQLFDPEEPEIESFGCFTLAEAQESLFGSTRYHPKLVHITNYHVDPETRIPVVLDLARATFFQEEIGDGDIPNWYFEGAVLTYGREEPWRVRIYVTILSDGPELTEDDIFTWQKITRPIPGSESAWSFR